MANKYCILTRSYNEKRIAEWVKYHLRLGFDYIFIYDDDSDEEYDIKKLLNKEKIDENKYEVFKVKGINFRKMKKKRRYDIHKLINKYIKDKIKEFDWLLYIDIDEFLVLNKLKSLDEVVQYYNCDYLKINWVFFGSNNLLVNRTDTLLDKFTKCSTNCCSLIKPFVKCKNIIGISKENSESPHALDTIQNTIIVNLDLNKTSYVRHEKLNNTSINNLNVFIAHFCCQDFERFIIKKNIYSIFIKNMNIKSTIINNNYINKLKKFKQQFLDNKLKIKNKKCEYFKLINKNTIFKKIF